MYYRLLQQQLYLCDGFPPLGDVSPLGGGSQTKGARSEIRRDPAEFNHCVQTSHETVVMCGP